jgi:hypothetical protein
MKVFPIRLIFKHLAIALICLNLTACGEAFLLGGLLGGVTMTKSVGDSLGKAMGDGLGKAIGCSFGAALAAWGPSVDVQLEQSDFDDLIQFIDAEKIKNENQFWTQLEAGKAAVLLDLIAQSYDRLDQKSLLHTKPKEFYQRLLGYGLIQAANDHAQGNRFRFFHAIDQKQNGVDHYDVFVVAVTVLHPRTVDQKSIGRCE